MIIILQLLIELYRLQSVEQSNSNRGTTPRGGKIVPYMGYTATCMCCPKGYGFTASFVINRVRVWERGHTPQPIFSDITPWAWYNMYLTYVIYFTCERIGKRQTKSRFLVLVYKMKLLEQYDLSLTCSLLL